MSVKVFLNLVFICYLINKSSSTNVSDNLLYNLAKLDFRNLTITDYCRDDLKTVSSGIDSKEIWALKLLDASGRSEPGFVFGNNFWFGSRSQCELMKDPKIVALTSYLHHENLTSEITNFPVEYRIVHVRHSSELQMNVNTFDRVI